MRGMLAPVLLCGLLSGCAGGRARLRVEALLQGQREPQLLGACQTLRTGDPFSIEVESQEAAYVYAIHGTGAGAPQVLFPEASWEPLKVRPGGVLHLPRDRPSYLLAEGGGAERLIVVLSRAPLSQKQALHEAEAETRPGDEQCREPPVRADEKNREAPVRVGEKEREAPVRVGEKEREAPVRAGEKERGLELAATLSRRGVAVISLPFRHE